MRSGIIFLTTLLTVGFDTTQGCRGNRGTSFTNDLANFFGNCPPLQQASVGILPSLQSVVDYVIRDSVWYKEIKERVCTGNDDIASCWINAIPILLKDDSPFETPLAQCICDWGGTCWAPPGSPKKISARNSQINKEKIKIPLEAFSTCLSNSAASYTNQFPTYNRFDGNSISVFLNDHFSYCRTVPTIPRDQWHLVPMLYVDTLCPSTGEESIWRENLIEVYKAATRVDAFLRTFMTICSPATVQTSAPTPAPEPTPSPRGCKSPSVLMKCKTSCPATCAEKPYPCSLQCNSEFTCGCPTGYVQMSLENKECVKEGACPRTCEGGKIFKECPSLCQPTCQNPNPQGCQRGCNPKKCNCPPGLVKPNLQSNDCIRLSECSSIPTVPQNARWTSWAVHSPCQFTCGPNAFREERRNCEYPDGREALVSLCGTSDITKQRFVSCGPPECPKRVNYAWTAWKCERINFGRTCQDARSCWINLGGDRYQKVEPQSLCGEITQRPNPTCVGC